MNKPQLSKLAACITISIGLAMGIFIFILSEDLFRENDLQELAIGYGLIAVSSLILICGFGLLVGANWARICCIIILGLTLLASTGFIVFLFVFERPYRLIQFMIMISLSIFNYVFLIGGILFLTHSKVLEEFGIEEE